MPLRFGMAIWRNRDDYWPHSLSILLFTARRVRSCKFAHKLCQLKSNERGISTYKLRPHFCENLENKNVTLKYKEKDFKLDLCLCSECHDAINYSFERLQHCQHEIKPRCRTCPTPCYEKPRWKNAAKIMIYSAMKLSLSKMKSKVKSIFS